MADTATPSTESRPARTVLRRVGFVALNVWLVLHLVAIVVAPASVSPSSGLVRNTWRLFQPYLQSLYLNHGYHFFAPEPSYSSLLTFTVTRKDGSETRVTIPNRDIQPRLLYHRHFMLCEQLESVPRELREQWLKSLAGQVCREHDGVRVGVTRVRHLLPSMQLVREGTELTAPESYVEEPLGVFECEDL